VKVYLAAAWRRLEEIAALSAELKASGIEITSRWLDEENNLYGHGEKFLRERAYLDLQDIAKSDAVVRFTDKYSEMGLLVPRDLISGARHFEFGYAKALGKTLYVVGGKQNVFDRLDGIVHVKDTQELKRLLAPEEIH
jgi:hypothetical protein